MKEEWRDIKGYEGLYQVSNLGRVKSLIRGTGNQFRFSKVEVILKPHLTKKGYFRLSLSKNNKRKSFQVHRLVAEAFIPNPNNYPQVNHKDENKTNNCVDNLEWCTNKYNCNYGNHGEKISKALLESYEKGNRKCKLEGGERAIHNSKVRCITTGKEFYSIKQAGEYYGISSYLNISNVCRGKRKYCGKHPVTGEKLSWEYIKD